MENETRIPSAVVTMRLVSLKDSSFILGEMIPEYADIDFDDKLQIHFSGAARVEQKERLIIITTEINYVLNINEDSQEQPLLLKHKSNTTIFVENFEEVFLKNEEGGFLIDRRFSVALTGICISTIRGILIEKTANHFLNKYPLPFVDPNNLQAISGLHTVEPE